MDLIITVIAVILFFVLSPSVLVRLPSKGDKYVVAVTHALVFGILFYFINSLVVFEGMSGVTLSARAALEKREREEKNDRNNPCWRGGGKHVAECVNQQVTNSSGQPVKCKKFNATCVVEK
jgi:hypothetical protein